VTEKWMPTDDELDAVAQSMPAPGRDAERIEQERTSILAQAAGMAQHRRASRAPFVIAIAAPLAVAAAFLIWFVVLPIEPTTPKETITAIRAAVITVLNTPDVKTRLVDMSSTIIGNQPEEFGAFIKAEVDKLAKLVTKLNLTAESIR